MSPQPPATQVDEDRCRPCRGSGQIVSNLGGSASTIACPWCEGTGVFTPGHDAQAARATS
jgi:DnaJ-class molecular chaperone